MNGLAVKLHLLTVVVAASYVTLYLADHRGAERLAPWYGAITLVLAVLNFVAEGRHGRR